MPWAPDYVTTAEYAAWARVGDTADDAVITGLLTAASRAVDRRCNRQFGQLSTPAARVYRQAPVYDRRSGLWLLAVDDFATITGATIAQGTGSAVAYASSGATAWPDNAPADGKPWTHLAFTSCPTLPVTPTIQWGWAAVPAQVPAAVKLQTSRFAARRDSPYGVAGSPADGSETRLLARLDPDVAVMLTGLGRQRRPG
jgi:hypothetical protein